MNFNNKINEALQGYDEIKDLADEDPEEARERFLEVLRNPMLKSFLSTGDMIDRVESLEFPDDVGEFKKIVDDMKGNLQV